MEETVIAVHYQTGSDRIHEFQDAGNEEYDSANESAEAFQA